MFHVLNYKAKALCLAAILACGFQSHAISMQNDPSAPSSQNCISRAEMQEIAQHFNQFSQYANAEYCYDGSQTANLLSSIMFMRKTAFSSMTPSQDELFSGRFASSWYNYFIGRIDSIDIVDSCPKGVVAYVYAFGGRTMYACPLALTDTFSSLDRASVFMHEARHIDGYPHITCSRGPRQGMSGACDRFIADGGSYAVTVETYAQLAKYATELHPALRAYARNAAVIYADEAFENAVKIQRAENLLLLTTSLDFHSMNPLSNQLTALGKAKMAGHILRRAQHLVIMPDDKTQKAQYIFSRNEGEIEQSPSDQFTEYNSQTPEQKANWVDFHSGTQWNARVFKNSIRFACDPSSANTIDLQIPGGQTAESLVYPEGYDRQKPSTQLMLSNGTVFDLGCANRRPFLRASAFKFDQKFKRIHKTSNLVIGLSTDGRLYRIEAGKSVAIASELDGQILEMIPQQTFQFFESN